MKTYLHYLYVILAAACWGVIGLFNRILGELGVDVLQRVTIRNFGALLVLTAVFAYLAVSGAISGDQFLTVFTVVIAFYFGTQAEKRAREEGV